jgi:hypothetical protein
LINIKKLKNIVVLMAFFNGTTDLQNTVYGNLIAVDTINEGTSSAGVAIEGILDRDGYIQVADITAPANAADGQGRLYKKTGSAGLFWLADSAGTEVNLVVAASGISRSGSTTDNTLPRWNGTNVNSIQGSSILVDDSNNMSGVASLTFESGSNDTTISATTQTVSAPTINIPDLAGLSGDMMITNATQTVSGKTISSSTWSGGTMTGLTTLSINDNATRNLTIASSSSLTAGKTLTFNVQNADRTISLAGNLTTSGANALTFTTTGSTNVTLPTSGTLLTGLVSLTTGVSGILPIANGGTTSSTALSGSSIIISDGTHLVQGDAGTTTTILHGNAAGSPTYSAVSLTADVSGTLGVGNGGTDQTSYTDGQLLIGNTSGNTLTKATLTEGSGITITNGNGSITIDASGSSGVSAVSFTSGSSTWSVPNGTTFMRFTLFGGGGGGGRSDGVANHGAGGGGGAGTLIYNYIVLVGSTTSVSYTVGAKGTGVTSGGAAATAGGDTSITAGSTTLTAYGGGPGVTPGVSAIGGSGGGGGGSNSAGTTSASGTGSATASSTNFGIYNAAGGTFAGGSNTAGAAGAAGNASFYVYSGASAGAGGGYNGSSRARGGTGGGSLTGYAGGAFGSGDTGGTGCGGGGGAGGWLGVGGAGGNSVASGSSAPTANSGAGGGGAGSGAGSLSGGDGAAGLVIIEYW